MTVMAWVYDLKDNAGNPTITAKYHDTNNPGWLLRESAVVADKASFVSYYVSGAGGQEIVEHSTAYTADATWEMVMGGR
jgi:hypothetical protein